MSETEIENPVETDDQDDDDELEVQPEQDEPEGDEEEPEAETEAAAPQTGPMDDPATWDRAGKSAETWRRRVSDLFAEDAVNLEVCPLCPDNLPGFIIPDYIPDELRERVIDYLRPVNLPEMKADPDTECCDVCGGHGRTLTGSPIPENRTKLCGKCGGNGFTTKEQRESWAMMHPPAPAAPAPYVAPVAPVQDFSGMPATDQWGRAAGTPNYGRDPAYMTAAEKEADPWARGL